MNLARRSVGDIFVYIFLSIMLIIALFPIFYAIMGSFKSNMDFITGEGGLIPSTWHIENYVEAWQNANFSLYTINSVVITALAIIGSLILTSMAGYVFARSNFPGKKFVISAFLATMFLATGTITIFPTFSIIKALNLNGSIFGMVIVYVFSINVANIFLTMGYIKGIPKEIDEAAAIDGCGFFKTYLYILMPVCLPILATIALLIFRTTWNDYMMPMVFSLANDDIKTLTVGVTSLANSGAGSSAYNLMLAGTAIALVPQIIFYLFTSKFFISGITMGSLKG
ncbi:carbohydrate ABC transporter permease [Neobacillus sp. NPDC093127]|uniref:carbohydrate ABC transporter permease n=1 Tax=Neobacillus sp. NPDC093127 TaxID=3364296 RepID=UPI0037F98EAD